MTSYFDSNTDFCEKLKTFEKRYPGILKNPVMKSFLCNKKNRNLLKKALCSPSEESVNELNQAFKKHYFNLRFTTFISNTIHFNSINYDKKERKHRAIYQLSLDTPVFEERSVSVIDVLPDEKNTFFKILEEKSQKIEDIITDEKLYEAVLTLTSNQRLILKLAYIDGLRDTEIARILNKTQQAVSKSHRKALEKLREKLLPNEK
jgi:RNA polymerase sigma factor (sigma-70 family)